MSADHRFQSILDASPQARVFMFDRLKVWISKDALEWRETGKPSTIALMDIRVVDLHPVDDARGAACRLVVKNADPANFGDNLEGEGVFSLLTRNVHEARALAAVIEKARRLRRQQMADDAKPAKASAAA